MGVSCVRDYEPEPPCPCYEPEPSYNYEPEPDYYYEPEPDYYYEPEPDYYYEPEPDYYYEPEPDYIYEAVELFSRQGYVATTTAGRTSKNLEGNSSGMAAENYGGTCKGTYGVFNSVLFTGIAYEDEGDEDEGEHRSVPSSVFQPCLPMEVPSLECEIGCDSVYGSTLDMAERDGLHLMFYAAFMAEHALEMMPHLFEPTEAIDIAERLKHSANMLLRLASGQCAVMKLLR